MEQQDPGTREYLVRCADDQVHVLVAGADALLAPAHCRTCCGRTVLRIYDERLETTCSECSRRRHRVDTLATSEPCG
jgi:hypothetical protein